MKNKYDGYIETIFGKNHDPVVPIELMNVGHHDDKVPKESWNHIQAEKNLNNSKFCTKFDELELGLFDDAEFCGIRVRIFNNSEFGGIWVRNF